MLKGKPLEGRYVELMQELDYEVNRLRAENTELRNAVTGYSADKFDMGVEIENKDKVIENIGKALERLTSENKHLKSLLVGEWNV